MQVAGLHRDFEDLTRLPLEQAVVRQDQRRPATRFGDRHHLLDEVQLRVAGLDGEVVTGGGLIGLLGPKRGIDQDAVEPLESEPVDPRL